jgi:hypothetical protein
MVRRQSVVVKIKGDKMRSWTRPIMMVVLAISIGGMLAEVSACRHVNSSNPKVIQAVNANDAAKVVKTIADSLVAANSTIESIQTQEPTYYAKVKPWLVKLAKANDVAADNVEQYKNGTITFDKVAPALQSIASIGLELDPTTFGFKNPQTQQEVTTGFKLLQATIASVAQQFGTGK